MHSNITILFFIYCSDYFVVPLIWLGVVSKFLVLVCGCHQPACFIAFFNNSTHMLSLSSDLLHARLWISCSTSVFVDGSCSSLFSITYSSLAFSRSFLSWFFSWVKYSTHLSNSSCGYQYSLLILTFSCLWFDAASIDIDFSVKSSILLFSV